MPLAIIALGANLPSPTGPPDATLAAAAARLVTLGRITACSSLYSTAPVGAPGQVVIDQPRFVNAALALETALSPRGLLAALLSIEQAFGRDRSVAIPNGPRTLDLDLILYGDLILREFDLELPHPRFASRAFVLVPLHEIAPSLRDPRSRLTVSELLQALRRAPSPSSADAPENANAAVVPIESASWRAVAASCAGGSPLPGASR